MLRQDRTNPSTAVSNWRGRHDTQKAWPSTLVSNWTNGGLFGGGIAPYNGYLMGGSSPTQGNYTVTGERLSFPNEIVSYIEVALSAGLTWTSGHSNNGVAGYTGAGYGGGSHADLNKWVYATETKVNLTDLPDARYGVGTNGDTGNACWIIGSSGSTMRDDADKITYSNDTRSFHNNWLSHTTYVGDASENDGVAGYYAGGIRSTQSDVIDKMLFSNESSSTLSATLSTASYYTRCTANKGGHMYIQPGNSATTTVDKLQFSSETRGTLSSGLSSGRYYIGMFCDKDVAFYAGKAGNTTNYDRWTTASDTRSVLSTGSDRADGPSGFANSDW